MLRLIKGITSVVSLEERLEIVRSIDFVDKAVAQDVPKKIDMWRELRFDILFKGDDRKDTEKRALLGHDFAAVGVEVVYLPERQPRRAPCYALRCAASIRLEDA